MNGHFKLTKVINGIGHYAEVSVTIEKDGLKRIVERCAGKGWVGQGPIEDVPSTGYDDWKSGALSGVCYAFRLANIDQSDYSVWIDCIQGMTTDTNSIIVACAATMALWNALDYQPTKKQLKGIETVVIDSWQKYNVAQEGESSCPQM